MINLDSPEAVKKLDTKNILESIRSLPDQIQQTWQDFQKLETPLSCRLARNIVIAGMGGSALGGRIIDHLISVRSRVPIEVFRQYHLPNYLNRDSLVVISSYSGNTEEAISMVNEALKKRAQIFVITTGGQLGKLARKERLPGYLFEPKHNPSGQPRTGLGYSVAALLALLSKCNFINLTDEELTEMIDLCKELVSDFDLFSKEKDNLAKKLAKDLKGKVPVLVASDHLIGSAHAFKNQLNETAKTFSVLFDIPELNHHLMEGLRNPAQMKEYLYFLFFESDKYHPQVQKRYPLTREVVEKNEVRTGTYRLEADTKIKQIFELLILGSFVSFYLAMLYQVDPGKIPWVDYFKEKLKK